MLRIAIATALVCLSASVKAQDGVCIDPHTLVHTTVGVVRDMTETELNVERMLHPGSTATRFQGTAWFLSSTLLATIGHAQERIFVGDVWKDAEILTQESENDPVRTTTATITVKEVFETKTPDVLVVLELPEAFQGAKAVKIRYSPLKNDERIVGIGYTSGTLRFGKGRLALPKPEEPDPDDKPPPPMPPYLMLETWDHTESKNDRYVFDHGSSGGPIFDCRGQAVGVIAALITQTLNIGITMDLQPGNTGLRTTTAWGSANTLAVSASPLGNVKLQPDD